MPLMWILSSIMIFLVLFVFLNLFFIKFEFLENNHNMYLLKYKYLVKW
uniref:ATP synthase F0 subunit 8 n=1 Tax=Ebrechtella tricuspidata TaxID=1112414 RepID=A0A1U7AFR4_9ARAC|nr:ATP synthase F0 subunit 8 [Ebrechtella tricuspidata]